MQSMLERIGLGRPDLRAWAMYDWANSAYQTTMIAAVFPVYYRVVAASGLEKNVATARLAWASAIAIMIVAIAAPILGAIADNSPVKKRLLGIFMGIGAASCFAMYWVVKGDWALALILFIVGNVGVAGSIVFYEALLPHLVGPKDLDRVSSAGYAIGYLGGGVLLGINALMIQKPELFGIENAGVATRLAFVSVGIWWLLFSIPLFLRVPEPRALASHNPQPVSLSGGFRQLVGTFHELRKYRQALLFLAAFLIYNDGIQTMIRMAAIYGEGIGIDTGAMITALLLTQFIGVPAAFAFGALASRIGAKTGILIGLAVYSVITVLGYFMSTAAHFFALAILVGLVQGGTQALSRSVYASMIPRQKSSEFFAVFSVFERYAGVLGPLLFGAVITWSGSGRSAILAILIFFVAGAALLLPVDIEAGRRRARADEDAIDAAG